MNTEYLKNYYNGIVVDNNDKRRFSRVKVQVQSLYEEIPIEHIPWASPLNEIDGKEYRLPKVGEIVAVVYPNLDLYHPHYIYTTKHNPNLSKKLQDLSEDEYKNFIALIFDHKTQLFSDDEQFTIDYMYNRMRIKNDGIYMELKDKTQKLMLGTEDADQPLLMTVHFFEFFDELMTTLSNPSTFIGNLSAPVLKPSLDALCMKYKSLKVKFLSDTVFTVDKQKVKKLK